LGTFNEITTSLHKENTHVLIPFRYLQPPCSRKENGQKPNHLKPSRNTGIDKIRPNKATRAASEEREINQMQKSPLESGKSRKSPRKRVALVLFSLTFISFVIALSILYYQYPKTYEATWKGRTYYFFFLWLFFLEAILGWEELQAKITKLRSIRTIAFAAALTLPTIYVVLANFYGLNAIFINAMSQHGVLVAQKFPDWMLLTPEYFALTVSFALAIALGYGIRSLKDFSITTIFLGTIGMLYTIDNLFPYGGFTPFQIIVPTTANLAASVLNLMGYHTAYLGSPMAMPTYIAWDRNNNYSGAFSIAWPCSGVESLTIYAITILLFLKTGFPWKQRIGYFVVGAIVTYFINILRIVTIFVISINGGNVWTFHDYYGQLYSMSWIMSYPLIIIGSRILWNKIWKKQEPKLENPSSRI
jgi:thaumarchaeosortase